MAGPAIRRIGSGDGAPLVLLHGFGGTRRVWNRVLPLMEGRPLALVDLPGHGASVNSGGRGGAGRMAKAILAELEAQGIDGFHLAGHSIGGAVSMLMALRAPERVLSLALVAPGGMAPEIAADLLGRFSRATQPDELRAVTSEMGGPGLEWPPGYFEAFAAQRQEPGAIEAIGETYRAMFPEAPEAGQGVLPGEQLAALPMPVSLIWGGEDRVLPCPKPAELPPNFSFTRLPGAGHMLPEERPEAVAELLKSTVARAG